MSAALSPARPAAADGDPPAGDGPDLTRLLVAWRKGSGEALEALIPAVWADLRRLARFHLRRERPGHTLQPTALVNESFLRLLSPHPPDWRNRRHFFTVAATLMKRVLIDHGRGRRRAKRNRGKTVAMDFEPAAEPAFSTVDHLHLSQALEELRSIDAEAVEVVELRYYLGLTVPETAEAIGLSERSVKRRWQAARRWLRIRLEAGPKPCPEPGAKEGE